MSPTEQDALSSDACRGCALGSRRDFVRSGLALAIGAMLSLGAPEAVAAASAADLDGRRSGATVSYPIPAADGAQIDRANQVILVRWQNAAYAFALSCPHQNQALRWIEKDGRFQCPKHKSRYSPDGVFQSGRATRGMDRYSLRREGDQIVVDVATLHEQTADPAAWDAAKVSLG